MMPRVLAACAGLLLALVPIGGFAQSDSGSIRIVVTEVDGKTPIGLARVVLDGPVIASELTGANGQVLFTDVPDGIYHARIAKGGYQFITSAPFEVINASAVTVDVKLASSENLKVIGTVVAHSSASVSTSSIGPDSAQRKLSNDLADALNKLSGVSVQTSSDDSDATQTVSLEGHDASQTQLTLDGIPLNAPGTAGNLGAFATDLFSGAAVHTGPQVGGLGGGVNFSTLEPTLTWMSQATLATGSNGKYNDGFAESGSFGRLGVALQSTYRLNTSLVDGMRYADASGLDYVHDGDSSITGNLAKLRYEVSDSQAISAMFLSSARQTEIVCLRESQALPCGYGPGNTNQGSVQLYSLSDDALLGETTVAASVYSSSFDMVNNQQNRYVAGVPQPIGFTSLSRNHGFTLNATLPAHLRHTVSVQAYGSWSDQTTSPLVPAAIPYYNAAQTSTYSALQVTDTIHSSDKLTLDESVGISRSTNARASALESVGAVWRPTTRDTYSASYALGGAAAGPTRATTLTEPQSLQFDCNANVAYGSAPGDEPGPSSSISERVGYTRALRGGSLSLQIYRQVQNGVVSPVQVNGTVLAAQGVLSPAYLAAVASAYASSAGCDSSKPFSPAQLYFTTPIGGVQHVYEGGSLTGYLTFGRLVLQPFWNVNVTKLVSNDPRIDNPYSLTIAGEQLPNVPLQRGGVVLDYKAPRSALEWLADAQYTAKNNWNNLPAYTQFDAAVSAQLTHGTLTLAANNLTNVYAGIFTSPQNAVPLTTQNGIPLPTLARPLQPRSYAVTYTARFGRGVANGSAAASPLAMRGPRGPFMGPGGHGGPGDARGPGEFRRAITPLPQTPPREPFAVQSGSVLCPADASGDASTLARELKAYVARVEAAKTAAGYPATMPAASFASATVTYHGLGTTYALSIAPKFGVPSGAPVFASTLLSGTSATSAQPNAARGGAFRIFVGCLPLHVATASEVGSRHLYQAPGGPFSRPIVFMPSVGMYIEMRQPQAGQESFRVYALPATPPSDPFEIRTTAPSCTTDLRNTATEAIGELRAYFSSGTTPALWTITPHAAKSGTWYQLEPGDPSVIPALLLCGRVASASAGAIVGKGWDGVLPPGLNYTQAFGIYIVRPQPPRS